MIDSLARRLAGPLAVATAVVAVVVAPGTASADPNAGTVTGVITRPDGSPAAGEVVNVDREVWPPVSYTATTDAAGTYTIADVPPATDYRVSVNRPPGRQYAHGETEPHLADRFAVTAGGTTTVDEQLLPVGTFDITVTEWNGTPARGASVILTGRNGGLWASGNTDAAGRLTLAAFAGTFEVSVTPAGANGGVNFGRQQFLHQKVLPGTSDPIVIAPDVVTTVTEQLLQPGSLAVSARDAVTGAPISDFCVSHTAGGGCTPGTGPVTVADVRPGPFLLQPVYANSGDYLQAEATPVVVGGQTTPVTVDLRPAGKVTATIVAADTGAPVANACVALVKAGTAALPDGLGDCTNAAGALTVGKLEPGNYHVFVQAPTGSGYGAQWVGRTGGVGAATRARTITVTAGSTTTVPAIRLDRAGTISGVVRSDSGQPVTGGIVSLHAFNRGGPSFDVRIDSQGAYSINWLGPYEWPLLFSAQGHARQWSGNQSDRRRADLIRVTSGQTTTYSPTLKVGTVLTGTITNAAGQPLEAEFDLQNAATGEHVSAGYSPGGTYRVLVLGPQDIKLTWYVDGTTGWYDNAADFASATRIAIPRRGTKTLNLVLNV